MKKDVKKTKKPNNHRVNDHSPWRLPTTFGQKASDFLTKWAGSWAFIIFFLTILIFWMIANVSWIIFKKVWDPYPFILLNLVLSCLAAIQAPVILMSQNRQGQKDRQRAEYDYAINRKSEREIRALKKQLNRIEKNMMMRRRSSE